MDAQRLQMSSARAVLPSAPASAAVARRLVGEACAAADASAFTDTAALLTSELVTNAVVHARSDLEVLVETCRDGLRVEVRDRDDRMPERREYDAEASTGRGALLVEALADAYGAEPLSYGGKAVWFSLGSPPPWEHHPAPKTPPSVVAEPVPVLLCGLPVALFRAWQQQTDALLREAFLAGCDVHRPLPAADELARAQRAHALLVGAVVGTLSGALRRGRADVALAVPVDDILCFGVLRGALGKATAAAGAGLLLCPPTLPELNALRDWCCDEVARQATGLPAQPWRHPTPIDPRGSGVRAACLAVRASSSAEVLADEHDIVIAVSGAASELLGWPDGHLEGARLTALVPERYVDAHLAGFRRLLLTGRGDLLNQPTALPARRRDGSEQPVVITLSRRAEPDGLLFHALLEMPPG